MFDADDEEQVGQVEVRCTTRAGRRRRATACSRCPRWPCTAASSTRCGWCARSPWPVWSPDTAPRWTSGRTRTAPPRRDRARRRSPAVAVPASATASSTGVGTGSSFRTRSQQRRLSVGRRRPHQLGVRGALGAQPAEVGRGAACLPPTLAMTGPVVLGACVLHLDTAAHSAVRARGAGDAVMRPSWAGPVPDPLRRRYREENWSSPRAHPLGEPAVRQSAGDDAGQAVLPRWSPGSTRTVCIRRNTDPGDDGAHHVEAEEHPEGHGRRLGSATGRTRAARG